MLRELWFEGSDAGPGAGGAYGRGGRRGGGLSNTLAVTPSGAASLVIAMGMKTAGANAWTGVQETEVSATAELGPWWRRKV